MGGERLRVLVGRERKLTEQENVYGEQVPVEKFDEILDSAIHNEYIRSRILLSLAEEPKSVKDLASELSIDTSEVLEHIVTLKAQNKIAYHAIEGLTPTYIRL
ncbi:MAG: ArsR family transcriptional regulator [Candidatus Helarchaeales archaeon]